MEKYFSNGRGYSLRELGGPEEVRNIVKTRSILKTMTNTIQHMHTIVHTQHKPYSNPVQIKSSYFTLIKVL